MPVAKSSIRPPVTCDVSTQELSHASCLLPAGLGEPVTAAVSVAAAESELGKVRRWA